MSSFTLGSREADHLTLHFEEKVRYGNYLTFGIQVEIHASGFRADYKCTMGPHQVGFLIQNVVELYRALTTLYTDLLGSAHFRTPDRELEFEITGDGRGHFTLKGNARERLRSENQLTFNFSFDQTFLPAALRELEELTSWVR